MPPARSGPSPWLPGVGPETRILDIGCGTGRQTRVLAQNSPAGIVAIDNHPPFVDELNREAGRLGLAERVEARVADMQSLDFADASFDLIWCEGAIYVTGFRGLLARLAPPARGRRACRPDRGLLDQARPADGMRLVLGTGIPRDPRRGCPAHRHRRVRVRDGRTLHAAALGMAGLLPPPRTKRGGVSNALPWPPRGAGAGR